MDLNLNKLPWYTQVGLFVALSLGLVAVFYQFYVVPTTAEMSVRQERLSALRADIAKGSTTANQLTQFKQKVAELESRLERLKAVLPEQKDVADLLRRIQTLATQSNLAIRGFKPAPTVTKPMHAEWPIALQLDGTYHNLGMFFDRVSKLSRIIDISNVDIRAKDKPEANSTITVDCVATTFVLLAEAKPAAPAAAPQAKPALPVPGTVAQPGTATTPAAEPYTYSQDDRRDPFVSLVSKGIQPAAGKRVEGLGALTIAEVVVRGVLISRGVYIALISGPDGKTHTARTNDRLADGTIRSITPQGLVIMQEVNDPLSLIKQREVRKGLRSSEDAKQ